MISGQDEEWMLTKLDDARGVQLASKKYADRADRDVV